MLLQNLKIPQMESTVVALPNSTILHDRVLWYDGDSTVTPEFLMHAIVNGKSLDGLFVTELTPDIIQYNKHCWPKPKIRIKEKTKALSFEWNIPEEYKNIDIYEYVANKLMEEGTTSDIHARAGRIRDELELYEALDLMDVLRTLIFVINTLIENNVVWGVGRGSSVSSYVLYLIGVHDVDSFKYGLNIEEFLRIE